MKETIKRFKKFSSTNMCALKLTNIISQTTIRNYRQFSFVVSFQFFVVEKSFMHKIQLNRVHKMMLIAPNYVPFACVTIVFLTTKRQ